MQRGKLGAPLGRPTVVQQWQCRALTFLMPINPRTMYDYATTISDNTFASQTARTNSSDTRVRTDVPMDARVIRVDVELQACTDACTQRTYVYIRKLTHSGLLIWTHVFAHAYLRTARACLPLFLYVEHGTAIVYCCSFYYPQVMAVLLRLANRNYLATLLRGRKVTWKE